MLSYEERELARQFRQLGASIVVPPTPVRARSGARLPLLAALALALVALVVIVVTTVGLRDENGSNVLEPGTASPTVRATPTPSASPTPTPSHRATPYGGLSPWLIPQGPTHELSGFVTQLGPDGQQHPVRGAHVDVWVGIPQRGYHWMTDVTDATGRYELWGLPEGWRATLFASTPDPASGVDTSLQPCAHIESMTIDISHDIEIVPMSAGADAAAAAARRGRSVSLIYGTVFEGNERVRVPVPNAKILVGGDMEPLMATTLSAADGSYVLCGVSTLDHEFAAIERHFTTYKAIPWHDVMDMGVDFQMLR